jgi:hypothetical protein
MVSASRRRRPSPAACEEAEPAQTGASLQDDALSPLERTVRRVRQPLPPDFLQHRVIPRVDQLAGLAASTLINAQLLRERYVSRHVVAFV